jgi:hypothetical protein
MIRSTRSTGLIEKGPRSDSERDAAAKLRLACSLCKARGERAGYPPKASQIEPAEVKATEIKSAL